MKDLAALEIDNFLANAETLTQLASLPAWSVYSNLLKDMRQGALERCADPDEKQLGYWQGVAAAIGEVLERPGRIMERAAEFHEAEDDEKLVYRPELRSALGMGVDRDGDF